jgi:hypothetical protein
MFLLTSMSFEFTFSLEAGVLYTLLLLSSNLVMFFTIHSQSPNTNSVYTIGTLLSVCTLAAVCLLHCMLHRMPDYKVDPLLRSQGFLPTFMIVYVGLNLGLNNEVITNSFAHRRGYEVGLRGTDHHPNERSGGGRTSFNADAELGLRLENSNNQSKVQKLSREWSHSIIMDIRLVEQSRTMNSWSEKALPTLPMD